MKKLLFTAAIAFLGFTSVNAQEFSFGPKAGLNLATLTGDVEDAEMKVGIHIGGAAEIMFNDKMGLQAELLFSMQGAQNKYTETSSFGGVTETYKSDEKVKLSYINIPVMFKYYIVDGFNVEAGPQVGFLISAKAEEEYEVSYVGGGSDYNESGSEEYDVDDELLPIDFGFNLGLGYKMDSGLNFGLRYNILV
ncbi:porin family protein [Oceanihabitans sediminis]|uniref:PorT family protein n=1 Tax=Oceanihabitans sediminis TaxID=1812012 RepID=A0A368P279_9FLAO|nr:porin family protein [Oceanihabitans sediminis]MDX1277709.1 porin family protein [Oceanihabitans sediminis]MDX1774441.1 porin family protein [Oceanihabitans sediminis]RBP27727.1 outer membrane protein with beta-barrel domain [Oceanihabitans sediminis]RCU56516.1 PorT family protein [Oceanihabitans sediminis]